MKRRVLITGASRGIGLACAKRLAADGWSVDLVARGGDALSQAAAQLDGEGHRTFTIDVSDPHAWKRVADQVDTIDAVVCAAGVIGPIGGVRDIDPAAFLATYAVNVGGVAFGLHALALPKETPIVTFSGGGATGPFARFDAYAASKAAVVRLVENLAADGWRINAVAPGFVVTAMQDDVLRAGPERAGQAYYDKVRAAVDDGGGDDTAPAADCVAWLLSDAAAGVSGKLIAARWDPWRDDAFIARLSQDPDLATLRRIDDQFFTRFQR